MEIQRSEKPRVCSGSITETKIILPPGALQVLPIPGEPTVYLVESASAVCTVCERTYKRWKYGYDYQNGGHRLIERPDRLIGQRCPYRFGCTGKLDRRYHRVDVAAWEGHGACACEFFQFNLSVELSKTHPSTWLEGKFRCQHIDAARSYALDLTIRHHTRQQMAPYSKGRPEMDDTPRTYQLRPRQFEPKISPTNGATNQH